MCSRSRIKEVGLASDELRVVNSTRIVAAARQRFFDCGYRALTMDDLAAELGLSKKTLYRHFASKDELVEKLVELFASEVRALANSVPSDESRRPIARLHRFIYEITLRLGGLRPHVLRSLNRFAPHIARKLDELRDRNIPQAFGIIFRQGQTKGMVRSDLDVEFAVQFWRAAIDGMVQSSAIERLGITPHQLVAQSIDLFFAGILTKAGRKDHESEIASGSNQHLRWAQRAEIPSSPNTEESE